MIDVRHWGYAMAAMFLLAGCKPADPRLLQGYVEGEFVHVAAPSAGQLKVLSVERGTNVSADAPLFGLDDAPEATLRDEAQRRLGEAKANLADARMGQRPTEIGALEAQLEEGRAGLSLSEQELERQTRLAKADVVARRDLDNAQSQRDQDRERVTQLEANLATAKLGARSSQIAAAEEVVLAQEAGLARAEWNLTQKAQLAPCAAVVHDTLYRPGDWVSAGAPVVVLLPAENVKVRAFIPEKLLGTIHVGGNAQVKVDGVSKPFPGRVSYIAPRAEFTPPVIYSQKMREKFVFMVELTFAPEIATKLHPGQPVDVHISPDERD